MPTYELSVASLTFSKSRLTRLSETELIVRKRKGNKRKYPFLEPKVEETNEEYSTRDEGERGIRAREIRYSISDVIREESEKARIQRELIEIQKRKLEEENYTVRRTLYDLTKSELGNVAKVVLSDRTITLGKGRQHQRRHRKILAGLYHSDAEETTEIEFRRSGEEQ